MDVPPLTQSSDDPSFALHLFGPLDAYRAGRPLPRLRTRKEQWLLALLALHSPSAVDREWLAGTLWPECAESRAFSNLRRSLTDLRASLGTEAVRIVAPKPGCLALNIVGAEIDVIVFDAAITRGDASSLEQAVALYRGPLLEGCLEEWAVPARRVREEAYINACASLAARAAADGRFGAAAGHLRLVLAADPYRETALRGLMEALSESGDTIAARQVYRDFRRLLRAEMNAGPSSETQALFQRLRAADKSSASAKSPCRLPYQLTSLIGRERERKEVAAALDSARMVTLTGVGGVGKTRLAIAVAEDCAGEYPNGVWFAGLAALSDPALVPASVAAALELREPGDPLECLTRHLQDKSLLLVLDNCEHLLAAAAVLAESLLCHCPALAILATSREALGVAGESRRPVSPLALSDPHCLPPPKELARVESIFLFAERAQAVATHWAVTAGNALALAALCRRLDGLPLAIELAAAKVDVLSVEEIGRRLDRLPAEARTSAGRHRTMQSAIDWSHDLLLPPERALLAQLSVFTGGWTLDAAEAVCFDPAAPDAVLGLLARLVRASLVVTEAGAGELRYHFLETVRAYAGRKREASGASDRLRERHTAYFRDLAESAEAGLIGPDQAAWLRRLEAEQDNLRAALEFGRPAEARLRLAGALRRFWTLHGNIREGRAWLDRALASADNAPNALTAKLRHDAGTLAKAQGDYGPAQTLLEDALAMRRHLGDVHGTAATLNNLGDLQSILGDYGPATAHLTEAASGWECLGEPWHRAMTLNSLGKLALHQGEAAVAESRFGQALTLFEQTQDAGKIATTLNFLGTVALRRGDMAAACACFERALADFRDLGDKQWTAISLQSLAAARRRTSDRAAAWPLLAESLRLHQDLGDWGNLSLALVLAAEIAGEGGDHARAVRLLGAVDALEEALGAVPPPEVVDMGKVLSECVVALTREAFDAAWEQGRRTRPEDALQEALGCR